MGVSFGAFSTCITAWRRLWLGRPWFAVGAAVIVVLSVVLRRTVIAKMDALQQHIQNQIQTTDFEAIPEFRKIHFRAILISLVQLVVVVWSLFSLKL